MHAEKEKLADTQRLAGQNRLSIRQLCQIRTPTLAAYDYSTTTISLSCVRWFSTIHEIQIMNGGCGFSPGRGVVSPKSPKPRLKVQVCVRLRPEIVELDTPARAEPTPPPSPAERSSLTDWRQAEADRAAAAAGERAVSERPRLEIMSSRSDNGKEGKGSKHGSYVAFKGARFRFKHIFDPMCSQVAWRQHRRTRHPSHSTP